MDPKQIAKLIIENIGGIDNIEAVTNCFTRIRLRLISLDKVQEEKINSIDGVLTSLKVENQYQVVLLEKVDEVYHELINIFEEMD